LNRRPKLTAEQMKRFLAEEKLYRASQKPILIHNKPYSFPPGYPPNAGLLGSFGVPRNRKEVEKLGFDLIGTSISPITKERPEAKRDSRYHGVLLHSAAYAARCDGSRTGRTRKCESYSGGEFLTARTLLVLKRMARVPVETRSRQG
jgi:hypothetical protein